MEENNKRLEEFVTWLSQTYFNGASPEQIVKEIETLQGSEQGQAQLQQLVQEFNQATSAFKKGGKIDQLVERRKKISKAQKGKKVVNPKKEVSTQEDNPYKDHKYFQQDYYGPDNVQVITATERNLLPVNQAKDPNSDWNTAKGEYDGNHLILDADNTGIRSISYGFGSQSPVDPRLHGADSLAALNQILSRMKVAGVKPGFVVANSTKVQ